MAPKIVSPMKEVKVKIGQTLHVEIKFIGAPPPTVSWMVDGKPLISDDRVTISNFDDYTIINTVDTKRSDGGAYTLHLKNDSGEDSGTLPVVILGKLVLIALE